MYNILGSKTKHTRKPTPMTDLRKNGDNADEAQRFQAAQAARDVAQLDVVSVWYAVEAKLALGLVDEAREIVRKYREGTK